MSASLEKVIAACRDAGCLITDAERAILTRRLRPAGSLHDPTLSTGVGPDPLAGAESDPVAAVEHLFTERTGLASRRFRTYPDVGSLVGQKPEPTPNLGDPVTPEQAQYQELIDGGLSEGEARALVWPEPEPEPEEKP